MCVMNSISPLEEFPMIPLEEVAELKGGYAFKSTDYTDKGAFVLRTLNIGADGSIGRENPVFIDENRVSEFERFNLVEWDTVFVMVGATLGKTGLVRPGDLPALLNQNMWVIRARQSLMDPRFLHYMFASQSKTLLGWASGAARDFVRRDDFRKLMMPSPPLAAQRAIAGVLGALDDKIESNLRIVKQMELLLLAHSNSLSTLPRVALHEVSKSYRRPVNPLVLGEEWVDHFSLPAFDVAAMPERCQASSIMSGKFGIETTSVLISRLNPGTPRVWCAHVREVPAMCSSEFLVLEPLKKSSVGALWLAAVHPSLGEQMVQRATGTSFSHQRIKSDDALSVEVPDIRMIDDQVRTECDELIEMVGKRRSENEHLSRLRDVLLPELLSGRLRVNDAESMMENV